MKKNKYICVANIGKPRGLQGEFFLNSYCDPQENIISYIKFLKFEDSISNIEFEYIKKTNNKFLSKIKNINEVEKIQQLTNKNIFIASENLPKISDNEVYWHELDGMTVIDENLNDKLGICVGVNNFGSNECLIIKSSQNSVDDEDRLIPFIKERFIKSIDKDNKIIYVDWEKGY